MKKLALSVVVLMVASAGVSISGAGCSSSSGSGTPGGGDSSTADTSSGSGGDSSGSSSGAGDSSGSSSGGGDSSGSSSGTEGGSCSVPDSGGIPVSGLDGGENTACETCIGTSCCTQQNDCINDTNMQVGDDAGTMYPACDLFLNCVFPELTQLLLTTDAGVTAAAMQAIADCAGADGGNFPAASQTEGEALLLCIQSNCATACIP